eukprot:GFUD01040309.1.p1 GENE.GFUD01040309.1~~GFUD01040309.1.p1  ORF type:complete len:544 (-),score=116.02 GFUD01040309.1:15-1646(-)
MSLQLLPPETLFRIFNCLNFSDLKAVVQVCRMMREIGEDPTLWKALKLLEVHPDDLMTVLGLPRLSKIEHIKISDRNSPRASRGWWTDPMSMVDEHVETLKLANLHILDISRCYLHDIDAKLLCEVLNNIEVVNANRANFSEEQLLEIFKGMSDSTRLKTLILNTNEVLSDENYTLDLSHINPDLFAKALTKLQTVQISHAGLTSDQLEALVKYMNKESKIVELGVAGNDVSEIDPEEFAKAMNKLEKLDLFETNLGDQERPNTFFEHMVDFTNLKDLALGFNNRSLNPKVFAKALNKIEHLIIHGLYLSNVHVQQFFKRMCVQTKIKELEQGWMKIKELDLYSCNLNMSFVNPIFLASGLNKLTKLKMPDLNGPQCLEVFIQMAQFTKLQYLDCTDLDLCGVPTDILAEALNKVEKVILASCHRHMTEDQLTSLFKIVAISTNINYLDLSFISVEHIPAEVLAQGAVKIETLKLVDSHLLREQIEEILLQVSSTTKLKLLEVSFEEASVIDEEIIERSVLKELRVSEDYEYDEENWMQFYFP